jgi:heme/copper-type cytochrome/quinol oxidase subunit 4
MNDELWRDLIVVTVWSTALGSLIQATVHLVTFGVLRYQRDWTDFGKYIKRRELSLGVKNIFRSIYETVLAVAITWQVGFDQTFQLAAVLILVTITTWLAVWYGFRFVNALIRESGMEVVLERINEREGMGDV